MRRPRARRVLPVARATATAWETQLVVGEVAAAVVVALPAVLVMLAALAALALLLHLGRMQPLLLVILLAMALALGPVAATSAQTRRSALPS